LARFQGAYTNNQPGYFTTLEEPYARPAGSIFFTGEHTDSFYSYQGFMEGALLAGARAADEALRSFSAEEFRALTQLVAIRWVPPNKQSAF
jgi:monoamine oxidase